MWHRFSKSNPLPHSAILPHFQRFETPDMAQSSGCPIGSFGERLRHCGRLRTSPYSPDWRSSMAGNAQKKTKPKNKTDLMHANINVYSKPPVISHDTTNLVQTMLKLNCFNTLSNCNPVEKSMRKWKKSSFAFFWSCDPSQGQSNWKAVWTGRTRSKWYFYNKYYRYEKMYQQMCTYCPVLSLCQANWLAGQLHG